MKGFCKNIEDLATNNKFFRKVLYTAKHSQLVVMHLNPNEEIGAEVHKLDQFFRIEEGSGKCIIDSKEHDIKAGDGIVIPAGCSHNIIAGEEDLYLYTIYSPPNHKDGVIHRTKADAEADKEDEWDGKTTE